MELWQLKIVSLDFTVKKKQKLCQISGQTRDRKGRLTDSFFAFQIIEINTNRTHFTSNNFPWIETQAKKTACSIITLWKLWKFTVVTLFWQKFRESNVFTKEYTKELIWRNFFNVTVNFSFFHTVIIYNFVDFLRISRQILWIFQWNQMNHISFIITVYCGNNFFTLLTAIFFCKNFVKVMVLLIY